MKLTRSALALTSLAFLTLALTMPGCAIDEVASSPSYDTEAFGPDRPWEISTEQGEMVLPNLFYAEAVENEQVMPTALDGRNLIDRMIYPTLGNPNLYGKDDPADSLLVVLRLEPDAIAHLAPDTSQVVPDTDRRYAVLAATEASRLAFHLVPREAREPLTTTQTPIAATGEGGAIGIAPTEIQVHSISDDMPEPFQRRLTLRCVFRQDALAAVPAGLYDLRFEVLRDGALAPAADGSGGIYEYQYNAVRVFDGNPEDGAYNVLNVTDTQISVGKVFGAKSQPHLRSFVDYVNSTTDEKVRSAAFITFNGDLHNGGSPGGIREEFVSTTYNEEARFIVEALRDLTLPIFLTPGNHDGHVSTGAVPRSVEEVSKYEGLKNAVAGAEPKAWPDFSWDGFAAYRQATAEQPGGWPVDIFVGAHMRVAGADGFRDGWFHVPRAERNMVLYDGFHQWRRTYGPLHFSWSFGRNTYVSINSYELRQHRRSGWGMYTVNYGGGMSEIQLEWLSRELARAEKTGNDVVLIAHHDPRGGHKGHDPGYYYAQVDYRGVGQSATNYLGGSVVTPVLCKLPNWARKDSTDDDCLHDGLQDWMRPDPSLDCALADRMAAGRCDPALLDPEVATQTGRHLHFSGLELVDRIATHPQVRTLLIGHTHYHSVEMLQSGDEVVPAGFQLSPAEAERFAALEVANPVRAYSYAGGQGEYDPDALDYDAVVSENAWFFGMLQAAAQTVTRSLEGQARELAVLRLTCAADLTKQKHDGEAMMGFTVLSVSARTDGRGYDLPQINDVAYYQNNGSGVYQHIAGFGLDRAARFPTAGPANPTDGLF